MEEATYKDQRAAVRSREGSLANRKLGSQSYNHKEQKQANSRNELGRGSQVPDEITAVGN